ncbi:Uncharacterized membrane protein YhiD, involved in acid resistance [Desulfotomaculum arcticum]|uniref:Uncharacterized membrane protein YhiD, involved in acid resistance n=1 Tax=Desulfotruncus arcticus DSM 17038 TaxID=1121424 RepID=A0A1I2NX72_9FIRM|nr:DUF4956 domain-containing protein [Desulfotruncus arcticus]SFG06066.1 Uncharacterized membrane protein YhiD, involved in acid resistance [Desulfotomaculum arcticum] [Desulfotruncus arcticus DSM 17038]
MNTEQLNFNDIFKSNFLDKVTSFSMLDTAVALGLAFVLGLYIFMVYKKTFKGVMYSASFGVSLLSMTLITTLIIMAISSNVILSLGMVGALSIVRFRSAIKEPIDIAFLFWAISSGIVLGAGLIPLAVFGSLFIGVIMLVFVNKKSTDNPYILVIKCDGDDSENAAMQYIQSSVKKHIVKSKTVAAGSGVELTVEIRLKDMSTKFVNEISAITGVNSAVLVSYNGEYLS